MNSFRTIIVSQNLLVSRGLMHYVHSVRPDTSVEQCLNIQDIIFNDDDTIVIIDQHVFTPTLHVFLNKIHNKHSNCKFVALCHSALPDDLSLYFAATIKTTDDEIALLDTLRKVFIIETGNAEKRNGNQGLSTREVEVLKAVALGLTNKEISDSLSISAHTVITHRKNISAKLGIKTIAGLAVYAVLNGIISDDEMQSTNN